MTEPSILSQARKQDEKLCERLDEEVAFFRSHFRRPGEKSSTEPLLEEAAARIRELNQALMEASHDRDRFMADAERRRRTKK